MSGLGTGTRSKAVPAKSVALYWARYYGERRSWERLRGFSGKDANWPDSCNTLPCSLHPSPPSLHTLFNFGTCCVRLAQLLPGTETAQHWHIPVRSVTDMLRGPRQTPVSIVSGWCCSTDAAWGHGRPRFRGR
eukprot:3935029-Rhodomonas_salina.1